MNARVFLLVLVTAAFMAIWDADRPAEMRQVVAQLNDADANAAVGNSCVKAPVVDAATDHSSPKDAHLPRTSADDDKLIPLPQGLHAGTWHAFNHEGDTIRITIERGAIPPRSTIPTASPSTVRSAASCVITDADGVSWCFVKDANSAAN